MVEKGNELSDGFERTQTVHPDGSKTEVMINHTDDTGRLHQYNAYGQLTYSVSGHFVKNKEAELGNQIYLRLVDELTGRRQTVSFSRECTFQEVMDYARHDILAYHKDISEYTIRPGPSLYDFIFPLSEKLKDFSLHSGNTLHFIPSRMQGPIPDFHSKVHNGFPPAPLYGCPTAKELSQAQQTLSCTVNVVAYE